MSVVSFSVQGLPGPQGSKVNLGHGRMVESSAKVRPWRQAVFAASADAYAGPLLQGPVDVKVLFRFPRPKSHYGTGKTARAKTLEGEIKKDAPNWVISHSAGDLSKLLRSTEDALSATCGGCVLHDDALIASVTAAKRYCSAEETPGAVITISQLREEQQPGIN